MIRALVGTLGLFLTVAVIAVGTYAAFSMKQTQTSEAVPSPPDRQIERPATVSEQTVTAGNVSWTVTRVFLRTELRSYTSPTEIQHGVFLTVDFEVENVSDKPVTLTGDSMRLVRDDINSSPAADVNSTFVRDEKNLLFSEYGLLEPGEKKAGKVNFDLDVSFSITSPSEVSGFELKFVDSDPTSDEERTIDLKF